MARILAVGVAAACGGDSVGPVEETPQPALAFTAHVTDPDRIVLVVPPGSVSGDETKGHAFLRLDGSSAPIYAPMAMTLTSGTWVGFSDDYALEFSVGDRYRVRFSHIDEPRADLVADISRSDASSRFVEVDPVEVEAGALLGHTRGTAEVFSFDLGVYDLQSETTDGPNAPRYRAEGPRTKLGSLCPFDAFGASLQAVYASRFGSIGGRSVPGGPCRTFHDAAGGGVAGEWFLASGSPDGVWPGRFAVGLELGGGVVRVAGIAGTTLMASGAADPGGVTGSVCYADATRFVFIALDGAGADVATGSGPCPETAPAEGTRRYVR